MIEMIVAVGRNGEVGVDDQLPWDLPSELVWFQKNTMGKDLMMGRKTYEILKNKRLKGRGNFYVVTTSVEVGKKETVRDERNERDVIFLHPRTFENMLILMNPNTDMVLVGGAQTYEQYACMVERLYLTVIDAEFEDANHFIDLKIFDCFREVVKTPPLYASENGVDFSMQVFTRYDKKTLETMKHLDCMNEVSILDNL